ncbi:MAG: endonuclease domain-containing protein [Burkholderiales bacterium]
MDWFEREIVHPTPVPTSGTPIEQRLLEAMRARGRLPDPVAQHRVMDESGKLITVPDFAFLDERIAIYCDGFAYHGNVEQLTSDARKRNLLQAMGWSVLTFWGRQILRDPDACEAQVWQCFQFRR